MKRADLHTHSIFSDGVYTPDELCRRAKFAGLEVLSITDHDTMNGLDEKRAAAKKYGLSYVDGWEISAYEGHSKIHVLGYGCECGEAYQRFMQARIEAAIARAEERVKKLNALGIPVTMEEVYARQADKSSPIHTMHVARAAAEHLGITEGEVYVRYLGRGKAAESIIGRPTPYQAIDCIHASGGVAFLAHPGRIEATETELETLVESYKDYGLDGIECHYTTHTAEQTEQYLSYARRYSLAVSGGSDTHWEDGARSFGSPVFFASEELLSLLGEKEF
jgi:predicted metal-dependent phosphoesterase TrpH